MLWTCSTLFAKLWIRSILFKKYGYGLVSRPRYSLTLSFCFTSVARLWAWTEHFPPKRPVASAKLIWTPPQSDVDRAWTRQCVGIEGRHAPLAQTSTGGSGGWLLRRREEGAAETARAATGSSFWLARARSHWRRPVVYGDGLLQGAVLVSTGSWGLVGRFQVVPFINHFLSFVCSYGRQNVPGRW